MKSLTLQVALTLFASVAFAQEQKLSGQDAKSQPSHAAQWGDYELVWKNPKGCSNANLTVVGKGVRIEKEFGPGQRPFFDAFIEKLESGQYVYKIQFVPTQLAKDLQSAASLNSKIDQLSKSRIEAMRERNKEKAKLLYQQLKRTSNALSKTRTELQSKQYDVIVDSGIFVVDEEGSIGKPNRQADLKKYRKKREEEKEKRGQEGSEIEPILY